MHCSQPLNPALIEAVLTKLGLSDHPTTDLDGLRQIYRHWCERVPFDNARKLIALREEHGGPLPGDSAEDYLNAWLTHGTGGTCWAGNGALCAVLQNLGFNARHAIGTMLVAPDLPPNHGTVAVNVEGQDYLVDASILHVDPLPLHSNQVDVEHGAWGVKCLPTEESWDIAWRPQLKPEGLVCRINSLDVTRQQFRDYHEGTRAWGPFNYALSLRANRGDKVVGVAFGQRVDFLADGSSSQVPLDDDSRMRLLVDELGYSEEIATRIPADQPMPPPPGSRSAAAIAETLAAAGVA